MVTQLADYEGLTVNGMEAIWAAGGSLRVEGRKVVLDDAAVAGLQRLVDETTRTVIHPASAEYQETESLKAFMQNRILTMRNWPYAYAVLKADPVLRDKVGVTELFAPPPGAPRGSAVLGGQNLVIPKNALHKEEARRFVRFLTDPRRQCLLFTRSGYVPVRTEVYDRNNTSPRRAPSCGASRASGRTTPSRRPTRPTPRTCASSPGCSTVRCGTPGRGRRTRLSGVQPRLPPLPAQRDRGQ